MKQLLLATATLVGLSSVALAAEPVTLSDSQLDNVTAGQTVTNTALPVAFSNGGAIIAPQPGIVVAPGIPFPGTPGVSVGPTVAGINLVTSTVTP